MKTSETQKSTHHQQAAESEKPFFGATSERAFFGAERAQPTHFFQPKASSPSAVQLNVNSDEELKQEGLEETETSTVQRLPAFESENNQVQAHREHPLLQLQRQLGNRVVTQMIQAKLTVGKPNDVYEQEADRVANTVMRMPDPPVQNQEDKKEETAQMKPLVGITPLVQRQVQEKDEPVQMLQRQATEEQKDEPVQTLQRQMAEKQDEQAQMLQRQAVEENKDEQIATPEVSSNLEGDIQAMRGGGQPLTDPTRTFFESRFGYNFGGVRVHTDTNASATASNLNAQAFTVGQDIFFNAGRYEPQTSQGKWLLAHELTHTVQQQPRPPVSSSPASVQPHQTAPIHTTKSGISASAQPNAIAQRQPLAISSATPQVQRFGLDSILNWVADKAANIPGFTLLTVLLGRNPINNRSVERSAVNLVRGLMGLVPGGELIFKTLQESGALDRAFTWLNAQVQQLNITWDGIKAFFSRAWDEVGITDGFEGAYEKIKGIFAPTVRRILNFALSVVGKVVEFIKEAILQPVGQFVKEKVPGYKLLTVILGKDPVTGEPVERNATNFIGGFLELVPGGKETFKNLQESGAIERATTWLEQEIKRLNLTWEGIKALFQQAWDVLSINDITSPLKAFGKIQNIFGPPIKRIGEFAIAVGKKVLEFVFEGVLKLAGPFAGAIMGAVRQAGNVFSQIIQNPIGFAGNLIKAVKQGFQQFSSNITTHLKTGLMGWLFGALATAGITLPQKFDLEGIVSLVLQVLGATYARLRGVLVGLIGEKAVARIEKVFDFLVTIATKGLAAAWEKLVEFIGSLKDMVIGAIQDWVKSRIVTAAVTKLISMFNPVGAVIQAIISVYNTVAFFMERAQQISMLVAAVTKSIGSIAAGAIGTAANFVELSMAKAIPVILGFLARFIGLGNVAEPIQKTIKSIQDKVWGAITKLANFIISKVKSLFGIGKDKEGEAGVTDPEHDKKVEVGLDAIDREEQKYLKEGKISREDAEKVATTVKANHPIFKAITVTDGDTKWNYHYIASNGDHKGQAEKGKVEKRVIRAFHGADGNKILGIIGLKKMIPGDQKIFLARGSFAQGFMHGGDQTRKASFVIEVELTFSPEKVKQKFTSTQGVQDTQLLETTESVDAEVLTLFIRKPKPKDEGGGFEFKTISGEVDITAYLKEGYKDE
ncbi:DUF4157 domain-containing protein [Dendronalium sp. ChiSLP03b]|uniref:eCIS core domain-containing protein n=1 Tax=Dendronalium sp. ChiSLP03b TaxID=3075381 RepID=UPI002AD3D8EC|nr:DUF4157 domain-containing protein [Dendronalium sp. ChiSLP03b]MDZ8203795.1 DUF4157 domain-containing protein [Dendronalium sp. ChiSLP03b]